MNKTLDDFFKIIDKSNNILVVQPDRPDGDSLGSALFLEEVLTEAGKNVYLYCGVNIPEYIRFIPGWDRVLPDLPSNFDMSILVDNASMALLEKAQEDPNTIALKTKPFVVADHHDSVECDIPFATLNISQPGFSSAGELLYKVFNDKGYSISLDAKKLVTQSILSDTMGLSNDLAKPNTYRLIADFIEAGVSRPELEEQRRKLSKMDERVFRYKAELISRTEMFFDGEVAMCVVPEEESFDVGTLYNPGPLLFGDILMVKGIKVAMVLKTYKNKATVAVRCTTGNAVADKLALQFGGGGHPYAAGFRKNNWNGDLPAFKKEIITAVGKLLQ